MEIQERIRQTKHVPTNEEERKIATQTFHSVPKYDFSSTGDLTLRIIRPWATVQTTWVDGKQQRIEHCLGSVVETLRVVAEQEHERRRKQIEEQQRQMELQQQRWEEDKRIKSLDKQLARFDKARQVNEYVAAVERLIVQRQGKLDPESDLGKWIAWMRRYAQRVDPSGRDDLADSDKWWY